MWLPKLPNGECYRTRGLWVTRDDTKITSDGACVVGTGPGASGIKGANGRPILATAVFQIDHTNPFAPLPVRIAISDLRIVVPAAARISGVNVYGGEVTLSHLTIGGSPRTNVQIGFTPKGSAGFTGFTSRVDVLDCDLSGGQRDVLAAFGPIGLRVERNRLAGARATRSHAGAGLHIRAADRGQPALDVRLAQNLVVGNAGPGIFLDLAPANGSPVFADRIDVTGNHVLRNARSALPARRAGIVIAGGQRDSAGRLTLTNNVVSGNHGPGLLGRKLRLVLDAAGNDLRGNRGGQQRGLHPLPPIGAAKGKQDSPPTASRSAGRDDTSWLQARLDRRGGTVFLPKLPNGECYATRGLWVSHDYTTITSDGACVVSLGLGVVRLRSNDGDPIAADAVFFVNRSKPTKPAPVGVTISNLRIVVPDGQGLYGVAIFGHNTTLSHVDIGGSPKDDVLISDRANANDYVGHVAVLDSVLSGAQRNAISAISVIDLRIERNVIQGVRDVPPGQPAAGIDLEPGGRAQLARDVRIVANTIQDNAGPGILLELEPNDGPALIATGLVITDNTIVRNGFGRFPPKRAGVVLAGGEDGGRGALVLKRNVIRANGGPGILGSRLILVVDASDNVVDGNTGGPTRGMG